MTLNSNYNTQNPVQPFSQNAQGDPTPLFLRIDPDIIGRVYDRSDVFLSLVGFVKEGNDLDDKATKQACAVLRAYTPKDEETNMDASCVLYDLVPTDPDSCSGFTKSILPLLASCNEKLIKATLKLLSRVLLEATADELFSFIASGFFSLLPKAFYEQEMHLLTQPRLYLMQIVNSFHHLSHVDTTSRICESKSISRDSFKEIFITKYLDPIKPFLEFICNNRRRIIDSPNSTRFSLYLGQILKFSVRLEVAKEFELLSSFALTYTDCLPHFETDFVIVYLLESVIYGIRYWRKGGPAGQKLIKQMLLKLGKEGVSDEIELQVRYSRFHIFLKRDVFFGDHLMHCLGGNVPF
ncbi:hypothetical protein BLNAU_9352 [Blattamonas nauphoetae]|uniref:Uncharacterized protein n=1 Tax=Blattamonas nauphoetae TaxID=2049346 RepID=A0ABQ9XW05_9EUKA|nr:hypothetical protein BLNAU_9352 [Blattamonas nauphoetae]